MKTYAIKDDHDKGALFGYLLYYERSEAFVIELSPKVGRERFPLWFEAMAENIGLTIGSSWSEKWVSTRIIPSDRQNLGMILRDSGLKEYHVMKLLQISRGRCSQDDCYIEPVNEDRFPDWLRQRLGHRLRLAAALNGCRILAGFEDGRMVVLDVRKELSKHTKRVLTDPDYFKAVSVSPGGTAAIWPDGTELMSGRIYESGKALPVTVEDYLETAGELFVDSSRVKDILGTSRQYADRLLKEGTIPVTAASGRKLVLKNDIEKLKW
ncbi:MAG: DUF2442 domain-containing protein [Lachnospiraceae bacterium]|nr:DUF2442 domain-containing protein [Lachnospiraceae bacterium]